MEGACGEGLFGDLPYWLEKESLATRQTETTNLENRKDTRYLTIIVVAYEAENKLTVGTKTRDHLKPE